MIIYVGNKATERDTLDFLTDMLADGYTFSGITMGCAKLKYTGHHDRSSKIGVMSKEDYDKLPDEDKSSFKYIDEYSGNVFYQTKKSIGDNNFYRNKKEEKERNISNFLIGGLVGIAVIAIVVKVISSMDTQSIFETISEIFLQPVVILLVFLPALIWLLAWVVYKLKISAYVSEDSRENRKKMRKSKLIFNTIMQFASFIIQMGIALAPLLY